MKPMKWTRFDTFNCRIAPALFFTLLIGGSFIPGRLGEIIRYFTVILVVCLASYCIIRVLTFIVTYLITKIRAPKG